MAIGNTGRAIGNLLPTTTIQNLTQRKYTLPDKTVASQVLMYRQLLHTKCRPGLRLSRPYQATDAQKAVLHMPWWEQGIEDSGKMVISYDNLIVRLWMNGAIMPFSDLMGDVQTLIDDKGMPPIPHPHWVDRLGFQQHDPVTDFRSGGVLSLAMMVHMVESCMPTVKRFYDGGDAQVLPFGITSINVTDMLAKFLMLAKNVDRMEALMSQKPFWRMFADPNAILAVQDIAMNMMCDVVVELKREKTAKRINRTDAGNENDATQPKMPMEDADEVTVFDFPQILEKTERRVRDDLLGAGPSTVDELKSIAGRLRLRYQAQIEAKEWRAELPPPREQLRQATGQAVSTATNAAAGMLERIKSNTSKLAPPNFGLARPKQGEEEGEEPKQATQEESAKEASETMNQTEDSNDDDDDKVEERSKAKTIEEMLFGDDNDSSDVLVDDATKEVMSAAANFSIDDDDDDEVDLDQMLSP
uniref:ELMO domain-containing protein n=1 Tax=Cyclophora tenuis TaxID=216820 RepID=A0A7S1CV80_CYCTE